MEAETKQFTGCLLTTFVFYAVRTRVSKGEGEQAESQYLKKVRI